MIRTSLICLAIAMCWSWAVSQEVVLNENHKPEKQVFFVGGINNQHWLTIARIDTVTNAHGFDPSFTYLVSNYKPVVKKLNNGVWQITFTSPIAENLP